MKKDQDQNSFIQQAGEVPNNEQDREEQAAMARYHWTQEVPSYIYSEDVRRADLHYNVLWAQLTFWLLFIGKNPDKNINIHKFHLKN